MINPTVVFEEIVKTQRKLTGLTYELWANHCVFSFQWWLQIILLFAPWFLWWKLVDRKRLVEILLYGLLVMIITTYFDAIGSELTLWAYPYKITPVFPRLITVDLSVLPITYMLIYQYLSGNTKHFLIATILISGIFAFIAEPLLIWLKIYKIYNWNHIYSFLIYIAMPLFLRWLLEVIITKQKKNVE